jgi:hypothetical protein
MHKTNFSLLCPGRAGECRQHYPGFVDGEKSMMVTEYTGKFIGNCTGKQDGAVPDQQTRSEWRTTAPLDMY